MEFRTEEEIQAERERMVALYCYTLCLIVTITAPYYNCDEFGKESKYTFDYKTWNVVFIIICLLHLQKEWCYDVINRWHIEDVITLRTRNRLRQDIAICYEFIHLGWQIYGNFIFYEWRGKTPESNEGFETCMNKKNPGLETSMFIFLFVGYFFFLIYILAICLIMNYIFRRGVFHRDFR